MDDPGHVWVCGLTDHLLNAYLSRACCAAGCSSCGRQGRTAKAAAVIPTWGVDAEPRPALLQPKGGPWLMRWDWDLLAGLEGEGESPAPLLHAADRRAPCLCG